MPTENTTTADALRLKWLERHKQMALRQAEKDDYRIWLSKQPRALKYKDRMDDFDLTIKQLERGMDECAALGDQGDFAVDLEPGGALEFPSTAT